VSVEDRLASELLERADDAVGTIDIDFVGTTHKRTTIHDTTSISISYFLYQHKHCHIMIQNQHLLSFTEGRLLMSCTPPFQGLALAPCKVRLESGYKSF